MQFPIPPFFTALLVQGGLQGTGLFLYNGTPAIGNPPIGVAVGPGTTQDPFGNNLVLSSVASFVRSNSDVTPRTITTSTVAQLTGRFPIIANDPNPGTCYRIYFSGLGQTGAVAEALIFIVNVSGNNFMQVTLSGDIIANQSFQFNGYVDVVCLANGVSGNFDCAGQLLFWNTTGGGSGTFAIVPIDTSNALNTTVANYVEVDYQWNNNSSPQSITCLYSIFERLGV